MTKRGYARVSTKAQDPQLQLDALVAAGVAEADIYTDHGVSGKLADRPALAAVLAALEPGDTLVVWKLDRLGRSMQHLVNTVADLGARDVGFMSLTEGFDTTTNGGRLLFNIMGALADFERGLIVERTNAGLAVAHAAGHRSGRKPVLTPEQRALARQLHRDGQSVAAIARVLGASRPTVYRALEAGQDAGSEAADG